MPEGKPLSQTLGVFHGREDRLSDSGEVAQPAKPQSTAIQARHKTNRMARTDDRRFIEKISK